MNDLPGRFDVDYELTRFLRQTRQYAMGRLAEIHPDLDYNAFLLLVAIRDAESGVRGSDLAESLHVHKSTVSRAVSTLERLGLVERTVHPDDGRAQLLTVPTDARDRLDVFRLKSHAWLSELLSDWSEDDVSTLGRMLARLNDAVGRGYATAATAVSTAVPVLEAFLTDVNS
jgi:DNA-binding MarR family transcriptional regulator